MATPTIIDCDPGCDDVLALLLALTSHKLDVIAFIPQFGNTDVDAAYNNILKIYGVLDAQFKACPEDIERFPGFKRHLQNRKKPLLLRGAARPISGAVHTAKYFHGADGLGNIATEYSDSIPLPSEASLSHLLSFDNSQRPGHEAILDLLEQQPDGSVSYIALGPLTNLALALQKNETLFKRKVALVTIMGGALNVPGNTSPVAEFNVYADASAAHAVFSHSGSLPIYLLPLDTTSSHVLPWTQYTSLVDSSFTAPQPSPALSPLVHFTSAFLRHTRSIMERYGQSGMELHDPLAAYFAMHNLPSVQLPSTSTSPSISAKHDQLVLAQNWQIDTIEFAVEYLGKYTLGMCVVDRRGKSSANEKERGRTRVEVQEESDKSNVTGHKEAAPIQVDEPGQAKMKRAKGINVVTRTPGSEKLVRDMLTGIWGAIL